MPAFVKSDACTQCSDEYDSPYCVYICPNDLMAINPETQMVFNQEPDLCSECFACIKSCPEGALEARGYSDFVPLGAYLKTNRNDSEITWEVKFRDGRLLHFTFPVRTTPVGSSVPYKDFPDPSPEDVAGQGLAGESIWLGVDNLSVIQS